MNERQRKVLNRLQGGFPVQARPYERLEEEFSMPAGEILGSLRELNAAGLLSRFGLVLNPRGMGGDSRLAAMAVPESEIGSVVEILNGYRTVTHNYLREHRLNLWFVMSADDRTTIDHHQKMIADETEHPVYDFPKLTEYYVGLRFYFHEDGSVETRNATPRGTNSSSDKDSGAEARKSFRQVIRHVQEGIPLVTEPYRRLATELEIPRSRVIELLRRGKDLGWIKRIGCVPDHYALGIRGNGMCVFEIPDDEIDRVGRRLGRRPEVTHCYQRPRYGNIWPYSLFAMVHERTPSEARETIRELVNEEQLTNYPHEVLFSKKKYKKTGLRI